MLSVYVNGYKQFEKAARSTYKMLPPALCSYAEYTKLMLVGKSYRVNCMVGAINCRVSSLKKHSRSYLLQVEIDTGHIAAAFCTQQQQYCGSECQGRSQNWTENSTLAHCHLCRLTTVYDGFELLLGMCSSLLWLTLQFLGRRCIVRASSPQYKLVISLGINLYMIYTASGLWPSGCKSHRDLYLILPIHSTCQLA